MATPLLIARARIGVFSAIVCAATCLVASPAHAAVRFHARMLTMGQPIQHAPVAARPHHRRLRLSSLQRAFHFGHGTGRTTHQTTQATSSWGFGLSESPLTQGAPTRRDLILPSSERIRFDERAGRQASRAPPLRPIN